MSNAVARLLDSRVLLVTGKGGTGKTAFSAALAVVAAARGRRVVLCEVDSQRPSTQAIFQAEAPYEPAKVLPNLHLCNVHWDGALLTYLQSMIPSRRVVALILESAAIRRFLNALPGAREIVILSRIEHLAQDFDLVVVDMPASGHAFSLLDVTRSAMSLFRSGPVKQRATELIDGLILHKETRVVFVALPEDMVVNETIETYQRMKRFDLLGADPLVFLNRATLPTLAGAERDLLARLAQEPLQGSAREFVRAGLWEDHLEQATSEALQQLGDALPEPPVLVPPTGAGGNPRAVVAGIAAYLGRQLGLTRRDLPWT